MDSTKVELINHSFDKLVHELSKPKTNPVWETLGVLLLGAALTFLAQWSIEAWKSQKDRKRLKRELISKGKAKVYLISQTLKELSMFECAKEYFFFASHFVEKQKDSDYFYNLHYEKSQEIHLIGIKLNNYISDYLQIVIEFQIITKKRNVYDYLFEQIAKYKYPKVSGFENISNVEDLLEKRVEEEERLNTEFDSLRKIFNDIQELMK